MKEILKEIAHTKPTYNEIYKSEHEQNSFIKRFLTNNIVATKVLFLRATHNKKPKKAD